MTDFLAASLVAAIPLLVAATGEIITEKAGLLNLGVEGLMLLGAVIGFCTAYHTESLALGLSGAFLAGVVGGLIFAVLSITLMANQVVTGLTLTIFGAGFASFMGKSYVGKPVPVVIQEFLKPIHLPILGDIPFIGPVFFRQDILVYGSYFLVIIACLYLYKTGFGLNLKAVGESAAASDAAGIRVNLYRYVNTLLGAGLCGLGGAYMSLAMMSVWVENVVSGRGWIAVALVIFAGWNPAKAFFGSFLFGALSILGFRTQSMGIHISQYWIDMLPYAATILIIIFTSLDSKKEKQAPADLSLSYFREER